MPGIGDACQCSFVPISDDAPDFATEMAKQLFFRYYTNADGLIKIKACNQMVGSTDELLTAYHILKGISSVIKGLYFQHDNIAIDGLRDLKSDDSSVSFKQSSKAKQVPG